MVSLSNHERKLAKNTQPFDKLRASGNVKKCRDITLLSARLSTILKELLPNERTR